MIVSFRRLMKGSHEVNIHVYDNGRQFSYAYQYHRIESRKAKIETARIQLVFTLKEYKFASSIKNRKENTISFSPNGSSSDPYFFSVSWQF